MAVARRGELRWFRFREPDKRRPVLVVGRDDALPFWSQIPVIPCSTQIRGLAWEVLLGPEDGLPIRCALKPEWIRAVDAASLCPFIAELPKPRWPMVEDALLRALGFRE